MYVFLQIIKNIEQLLFVLNEKSWWKLKIKFIEIILIYNKPISIYKSLRIKKKPKILIIIINNIFF